MPPKKAKADSLKATKELSHQGIAMCLARVPNSSKLFFGSSDFKVYEVDLAQPKPVPKELGAHQSYVTGAVLAGNQLITGSYDGRLIWWDTDKRSQVRAVNAHQKWIRKVAVSPDGKTVASVADDMVCRVWDAQTGQPKHELRGHKERTPTHFPSMLFVCTFSPDGKLLATADKVGHIVVWDVASGQQRGTLEAPGMYTWDGTQRIHSIGGIRGLAFSPDGKLLAAGGIDKIGNVDHLEGKVRLEVFDWEKKTRTLEFLSDKFKGIVEKIAFHPKGDWLLAVGGAGDGFLVLHDLKGKAALRQEKLGMHIHDLAVSETGDSFFAAGHHKLAEYAITG